MDAFFASVEVLDDPSLKGRPVLVGGRGRRSVVAAASYEARRFGCHSAQPMTIALRRCPEAVVVAPRIARYVELSEAVFELFSRFTPLVEGLSIDEAFLDLSGTERLHGTAEQAARRIRELVLAQTGLTCSVGVASCKFVAKIASDHNKPDGLTVVPAGEERAFLAPLPIRALWGVGPKTEEALNRMGITRVGEIASLGAERLEGELGEHGLHLHRLSLGLDQRPVEPGRELKQVSHEDTFEEDLVGGEAVRRSLLSQSTRVADRLVLGGWVGRVVTIKLRDVDFNTETRQRTLERSTDQGREIYRQACALLDKLELEGRRFRLTGVGVAGLSERSEAEHSRGQLSLLAVEDGGGEVEDRGRRVQGLMTALRDKYGGQALFPAGMAEERGSGKSEEE
jgi:DNA polymerase-4